MSSLRCRRNVPAFLLLIGVFLLSCLEAFSQTRPKPRTAGKKIGVQWEGWFKGTGYFIIPYELVYPESLKKLSEQFKDKWSFFFVVVDNTRGSNMVTFNPKQADFFILLYNGRRTGVDLSNTMKDPSQDKNISKEFKDLYQPIQVPKGEVKWALLVMSPFALGDATSAYWSFPGENQKMKEKPIDPNDIRRYKLKPVPGTEKKTRK